jgi:hypothetical protein
VPIGRDAMKNLLAKDKPNTGISQINTKKILICFSVNDRE